MSFIYKTLFEVKLMHEYYLVNQNGNSIFTLGNQPQRLAFLEEEFSKNREGIESDLTFDFTNEFKPVADTLGAKIIPGYSGFKVVIRVNKELQSDGAVLFKPFNALKTGDTFFILLKDKRGTINTITNSRIERNLMQSYFFTNSSIPEGKTFPFLSNRIAAEVAGIAYEQGELINDGGQLKQFYPDNNWINIPGSAFVNESDRILTSNPFNLQLSKSVSDRQLTFTLKDKNDEVVFDELFNIPSSNKIAISIPEIKKVGVNTKLSDCLYKYEVSGSNGFSASGKIVFSDWAADRSVFGVIGVQIPEEIDMFRLMDDEGYILTRWNAAGQKISHPIFELNIKSRFVHWRFANVKGLELKLDPTQIDYLDKENKKLITKAPVSTTKYFAEVRTPDNSSSRFFSNPSENNIVKDNRQRLIVDVKVPQSSMFPVVP